LALFDLNAVFDYHRRRNAIAAKRLMARLRDGAELIASNPEAGAVASDLEPEGKYRHLVVRPYRIIYRIDVDRVYILRVWDSRRNPDDLITGD